MRIFFITSKLNFRSAGGSVEELDLMMKTIQKWGHQVTAVTTFSSGNDSVDGLPYNLIEENIPARGLLGIQWGIYQLLKKYEQACDVFQIDGHLFLYGAGLYRRLGGKTPISAYFNRELSSWPENQSVFFPSNKLSLLKKIKQWLRYNLEKYLGMPIASGIDVWSTISPQFKQKYLDFGLTSRPNEQIVGDPIDLRHLRTENHITVDSYPNRNKRTGPFTIFYSSRMAPGKGFDVLITAFSKLKNQSNFRLILGGSGPEESQVRGLIKKYGLDQFVTLPGWVDKEQLIKYHQQADIFVQADWMIFGTSISLLYALAFCLPVIIPGDTGMQWVAKDACLTFPYRDPAALASKIEQLANDYALREKLSRLAWRRLEDADLNCEQQITALFNSIKSVAKLKA